MSKHCVSQTPHSQDGAWSCLVCFSAMMSWTAAVGFAFSFGIFFPVFMEYFNEDRERTAWIGSLSIALIFFTGPVSGILVNKFGCRLTTLLGALICAASLATASLCESLVTLYISYSILFGIGTSFVFNAGLVIVSNYFSKRRSLALGFVSAGQGLGVLAQGPLLQALVDSYGWKTTYRIMAGVVFGICLLGITYDPNVKFEEDKSNPEQLPSTADNVQPRPRPLGRRGIFLDLSVWKVPAFVAITLSSSVAQFGHFVPQIHLVQFCEDLGITADKASKLYIYYGLASGIARVIAGRICDVRAINPFYIYQSVEFVVGLSMILVTLAKDYTAMIVFAAFYGFCDGAFITTLNVILMTCVDGNKRPAALGWNMQFTTIFMASGPPIAGLMADKLGSYDGAFYMSGSVVMLGAAIPFVLLFTKRRETLHEEEKGQEPRYKPSRRLVVKNNSQDGDLLCCENMTTNFNFKEANLGSPCDDVMRPVIDTSHGVGESELSCTKANRLSGEKNEEDGNNAHLPQALADRLNASQLVVDGFVNESFTLSDEAIFNNTEMRQTGLQAEVEAEINSPLSLSVMKDNEQETAQELEYNTQL